MGNPLYDAYIAAFGDKDDISKGISGAFLTDILYAIEVKSDDYVVHQKQQSLYSGRQILSVERYAEDSETHKSIRKEKLKNMEQLIRLMVYSVQAKSLILKIVML